MEKKIYYKIYKICYGFLCSECGKKEEFESDFLIDETEMELAMKSMGTKDKLCFKSGLVKMENVSCIKYVDISYEPLIDKSKELRETLGIKLGVL